MVLTRVLLWIVLTNTETDVTFLVTPDSERIPISDKNPLSNIEFTAFDDQWILYAFLNDP